MEEEKTKPTFQPVDISVREHLIGARYRAVLEQWDRANDRLFDDVNGAITAARTLVEATCKLILEELKVEHGKATDLPKLYNLACKALDMAPGAQSDPLFKTLFSSTYTAVHAVGEIRNKFGDAHGKATGTDRPSLADAELVVHFAGAIACFIVRRFESHLTATQRLTTDGQAILKFDKSMVWRLVDHSNKSPESMRWYGEAIGRNLILVGDSGIYLMSNGLPPLMADGKLLGTTSSEVKRRLTAEAEGCGPSAEFEAWWPVHNAIDGGNDFSLPIAVDEFRDPLEASDKSIVMIVTAENYTILSDVEFGRYTDPTI